MSVLPSVFTVSVDCLNGGDEGSFFIRWNEGIGSEEASLLSMLDNSQPFFCLLSVFVVSVASLLGNGRVSKRLWVCGQSLFPFNSSPLLPFYLTQYT
jgi:hypothetical protein